MSNVRKKIKENFVLLSVRLSGDQVEYLKNIASCQGLDVSKVLRQILTYIMSSGSKNSK